MAFEDVDMDEMDSEPGGTPPPEESNNRSFLIVAGILGGIALLALICIAVYALVLRPLQQNQRTPAGGNFERPEYSRSYGDHANIDGPCSNSNANGDPNSAYSDQHPHGGDRGSHQYEGSHDRSTNSNGECFAYPGRAGNPNCCTHFDRSANHGVR